MARQGKFLRNVLRACYSETAFMKDAVARCAPCTHIACDYCSPAAGMHVSMHASLHETSQMGQVEPELLCVGLLLECRACFVPPPDVLSYV